LAHYQYPNPLDLLFFAEEQATRRAGLPGVHVHIHLELRGQVDVAGLRRALLALYRVYPTAGARRELEIRTGRPRWRLDSPAPDMRRVVQLHAVTPPTAAQLQHDVEALFAAPLDIDGLPPVQFHVFRGLPRGDVVVMRWPHALTDGRGAYSLLEELARLYDEAPDPAALTSAGDERRDDFGRMLADYPIWRRLQAVLELCRPAHPGCGPVLQLAPRPGVTSPGPMHFVLRHLTPEQTVQVGDRMRRVAGTSPSGDYLRGCALHALHELMPKPQPSHGLYTVMLLLDNRRRQGPAMCWNLTSALPLIVPAEAAGDPVEATRVIHRQTIAHVRARTGLQYYAALSLLMYPPTAYVAAVLRATMLSGRRHTSGLMLAGTPSLRLDFIGPFSRPLPRFCGAELHNHYGYSTLLPEPGFALHVNLTHDRLNIIGVCFESRVPVPTLTALMDRFVATLLDA
jgi:hypothetical protein